MWTYAFQVVGIGILVVFSGLGILAFITYLIGRVASKFGKRFAPKEKGLSDEEIAAIASAIRRREGG